MKLIEEMLQSFRRVTLSDLDKVKLMNRTDQKFCMHISRFPEILNALKNEYSILEIDGDILFNYDNTYFDTPDDQMYLNHHNRRTNRFKIRIRNYVESNLNFLEIKQKNNKGRTNKKRITRTDFDSDFTDDELAFIDKITSNAKYELTPKLKSFFNRITIVNNDFTERVTIDFKPGFKTDQGEIVLENLVIIEVKQDKSSDAALITKVLREHKVFTNGFSKYAVGRSLLDNNIKKNRFKPILLRIKKEFLN